MKKLQNLKGAKALNRKEQQALNGGGPPPPPGLNGPCGPLGGTIIHYNEANCQDSYEIWYQGACWVCFE